MFPLTLFKKVSITYIKLKLIVEVTTGKIYASNWIKHKSSEAENLVSSFKNFKDMSHLQFSVGNSQVFFNPEEIVSVKFKVKPVRV